MPPVDSPCIGVCRLDPASKTCLGCGRLLSEIAKWPELDSMQKAKVWTLIPRRIQRLEKARKAIGLARSSSPVSGAQYHGDTRS